MASLSLQVFFLQPSVTSSPLVRQQLDDVPISSWKTCCAFLWGREWLGIQVAGSNYQITYFLIGAICCAIFLFPFICVDVLFLEIKQTEMSRWMINTAVVQEDVAAAFPQEQAWKSLTTSFGTFRDENNTVNAVKKRWERQILLPRKRETSIKVLGQSAPSLAASLRINVCSHKIHIKSFSVNKIVL